MAPPVRPSRSLEGLERVIPPLSPHSPSIRPDLFLNKPLPAKPFSEQPECSAMWSDSSDSDSESTIDSLTGFSEPRNSADSYPIFVSSGSDFDDLVDHPAPSDDQLLGLSPQLAPHKRTDSIDINTLPAIVEPSTSVSSSFSDTQYGNPSHWTQNRTGTNHYFREKKWDYFPELAPSAVQATGRISPNMAKYRWHSLDRGGFVGVRDSIKTYVHRTLSRDSTGENKKEIPRPSTAPTDRHLNDVGGTLRTKAPTQQSSLVLDINAAARATSVATSSSSEYDYTNHKFYLQTPISPTTPTSISTPTAPRAKQLAVPQTAYQKHGPVIWESPKKSTKRNVQFPRYKSPGSAAEPSSSSAPDLSYANASHLPQKQSPPNPRGVFLGAKKKITPSKDDRRREQLKAQIKLVGPVNPHTYAQGDPWV
ncbi:unnamed protein product [Penicillium glandicola]